MQFRRAVLVVILLALIGSAFFVAPAQAQTGNCNYARYWDFTAGDFTGWTITNGNPTANGVEAVFINPSTKRIDMKLMCDAPIGNPRRFQFGYWSSHGWTVRPYNLHLVDESGNDIGAAIGQGSGSSGYYTYEYSGDWSAVYGFRIDYQWGSSESFAVRFWEVNHTTPVGTVTPTLVPSATPDIIPGAGAGWSYPVAQRDRPLSRPELYRVLPVFEELSEFTELEPDVPSIVAGFSLSSGANVHAILPGTITSVSLLNGFCLNQGSVANLQSGSCQMTDPGDPVVFAFLYMLYANAYLITQDIADGRTLYYVVATPRVQVGDVIEQDCIIGATIPMTKAAPYPIVAESAAGWTLFGGMEDSEPFDLLTPLSREPDDLVCRAEPSPQCSNVRNPDFSSPDSWELGYWAGQYAQIAPGGGLIPTGYAIQHDIVLDPETEYSIIVRHVPGIPSAAAYSFIVSLGTTDTVVSWTPDPMADAIVMQEVIIPPQTYEPIVEGGLYDLTISSLHNSAAALIDFICIFDPDGDVPQPAGGCILFNPEFDQQEHWTKTAPSGGGPAPVFQSGLAFVIDEASISQTLRLSPKEGGPQGYILSVYARRAGTNTGAENIDLDWEWGTYGGTLEDYVSGPIQDVRATFSVSLAQTNDLLLTVDATDSPSVATMHIDRVCIFTDDGVNPPGYLDPPLIAANCKICIYEPSGDLAQDLSELVGWLGCMLLSLWECSVKSVLVGMWTVLTSILMMLGYMRMWLSLSFMNFAEWANANAVVFAQYLGSEFTNLGTRIQNSLTSMVSISQIQTGNAGIWDVLLALINQLANTIGNVIYGVIQPLIDLVREIAGGLLNLIAGMIDLIAALIGVIIALISGFVVNAIGTVLGIFQAIINGVNMAPAAIPSWLAACSDPLAGAFTPDSQIGYLCLGVYVMEQRLQQGAAQYFIPIFVGLGSLALLLWGAQALIRAIASLGGGDGDE